MIAFELAAAIAGLAAAPQYIEPDRYSATVRPGNRTSSRAAPAKTNPKASPKAAQRQVRKPAAACATSHKGSDARGKRQNCPR